MKRGTRTTATTLVLEALVKADDFRNGRQLQDETGLAGNRVSAALYHLLKHQAVDLVEAPDNLWWFATPESDTRVWHVDEKVEETRQRKPRKPGKRGPRKHRHPQVGRRRKS